MNTEITNLYNKEKTETKEPYPMTYLAFINFTRSFPPCSPISIDGSTTFDFEVVNVIKNNPMS